MFQKVFQNSILFCINHSNIQRPHLFSDLHSRKLAILLDYECSIAYLYIHSHTPDQLYQECGNGFMVIQYYFWFAIKTSI